MDDQANYWDFTSLDDAANKYLGGTALPFGRGANPLFEQLKSAFHAAGKSDADLLAAIQADRNASGDTFTEGTGLGTRYNAILQHAGLSANPNALAAPGWSDAAALQRTSAARAANAGGGLNDLITPALAGASIYFGGPALAGALGGIGGAASGGSALASAGSSAAGGGMFDLGGGLSLDEFGNVTGGLFQGGSGEFFNPTFTAGATSAGGMDLGGGLSVDEFGNVTGGMFQGGPGTPGSSDFFSPDFSGGPSLSTLTNLLKIPGVADLLKRSGINIPGIGGSSGTGGGSFLNTAGRMAPGIAALLYANSQPGIDTSGLQGVMDKVGGNQNPIIQAATDPLQQNIAAGYGDLLQSQAARGIRGSSFGDNDIANYISTTGRSLANAGANAAEGSLALQGDLAGKIAALKTQAQQIKNNIFGRAFDVLGRGLNPTPTFALS